MQVACSFRDALALQYLGVNVLTAFGHDCPLAATLLIDTRRIVIPRMRTGDDPANVADGLPFLGESFVTKFLKTVRKPKVTAQGAVLPPRTI